MGFLEAYCVSKEGGIWRAVEIGECFMADLGKDQV